MKAGSILHHLFAFALLLTACAAVAPVADPDPAPTVAPATQTATIEWFPPTATHTPRILVTPSPTPDYLTGLGEILLEDAFETGAPWSPSPSSSASLTVSRNRLTLAVPAGFSIYTLREAPALRSFYAEVTAQTNLCRGRDEYGMLFRVQDPSSAYRLVLTCEGQVRLERLNGSAVNYIVPAQPSGDAPPGAPGQVRLGVWMLGSEIRVFLNGRYQFSAREPTFPEGRLGLFARANSGTALNIAFSDLVVRAVVPVAATATPGP